VHSLAFTVRLLFVVRRISSLPCTQLCHAFFSFFAVRSFVVVRVFVIGRQNLFVVRKTYGNVWLHGSGCFFP
jgi:hypothetical protein